MRMEAIGEDMIAINLTKEMALNRAEGNKRIYIADSKNLG